MKLSEKWFGREARRRWKVGDKIEAVTKAVGIAPCGSCKKRKAWMNGDISTRPERDE